MRCLRCALDYGPDERYCNHCGRALSRPPGENAEGPSFSGLGDSPFLYSTTSPPSMGDALIVDADSADQELTALTPDSSAVASNGSGGSEPHGPTTTQPTIVPRLPKWDGALIEEPRSTTPGNPAVDGGAPPGAIYIAPPSSFTALDHLSDTPPMMIGTGDDDELPLGFNVRSATVGDESTAPSTGASKRTRRSYGKLVGLAVVILLVVVPALLLGTARHNAYTRDLQSARRYAAVAQYPAARAAFKAAIGDWPFNGAAKNELAAMQATVVSNRVEAAAVATASSERASMFEAHAALRVAAGQLADESAVATATAATQATAVAVAQNTQAAQVTATAVAGVHGQATSVALAAAGATAAANSTATAVARVTATAQAEASSTVVTLPAVLSHPVVYGAIGASETVGVGANDPATQSWVADLAYKLPSGSQLINVGKSGALLSYGVDQELPSIVTGNPDLVTVWMVVNDINAKVPPEQYRTELDTMLRTLRLRTHAAIYVGTAPDLSLLPIYRGTNKTDLIATIKVYNSIIYQVAAIHKATVVDLFGPSQRTLPQHPEYISNVDGFHPSTLGYAEIANEWWQAIKFTR